MTSDEVDLRRLNNSFSLDYLITRDSGIWEAQHRKTKDVLRADSAEVLRQQIVEHRKGQPALRFR